MLAIALIVLASSDMTLVWSSGESSRDFKDSTTTWTVKGAVLTYESVESGRNAGLMPPEKAKPPHTLTADEQKKLSDLLAACDSTKAFKNDAAHEGVYTDVTLTYGPKKRSIRLHYDYDVVGASFTNRLAEHPADSPARAAAFAKVKAIQDFFYSLPPPP